jgi:hypothetical protein
LVVFEAGFKPFETASWQLLGDHRWTTDGGAGMRMHCFAVRCTQLNSLS